MLHNDLGQNKNSNSSYENENNNLKNKITELLKDNDMLRNNN